MFGGLGEAERKGEGWFRFSSCRAKGAHWFRPRNSARALDIALGRAAGILAIFLPTFDRPNNGSGSQSRQLHLLLGLVAGT